MARAHLPFPLLLLLTLLAAAGVSVVCAAERTVISKQTLSTTTSSSSGKSTETLAIKSKLDTAQGKVSDLISRLDSVSDDATRAKNEIHSTLIEVSRIAEQLGKDRCADVVEKFRVEKQQTQATISSLTQQIDDAAADADEQRRTVQRLTHEAHSLRNELSTERTTRQRLEADNSELRDKLHWANAVANETAKYELVADRLRTLLAIVTERTQLLERLQATVSEASAGTEQWRGEVQALSAIIRDAESDFVGGYQNAAVQGLRRQTELLQRQLSDALQRKDALAGEKGALQKALDALQNKLKRSAGGSAAGGGGGSSALSALGKSEVDAVYSASAGVGGVGDGSQTWVGTLTLCILSVCTGAVLVFLLSNWQANKEVDTPRATGADKFGFTPSSSATTPGAFQRTSVSPLQYVKTPASRGSTPRRY